MQRLWRALFPPLFSNQTLLDRFLGALVWLAIPYLVVKLIVFRVYRSLFVMLPVFVAEAVLAAFIVAFVEHLAFRSRGLVGVLLHKLKRRKRSMVKV